MNFVESIQNTPHKRNICDGFENKYKYKFLYQKGSLHAIFIFVESCAYQKKSNNNAPSKHFRWAYTKYTP